MLGIVTPGAGAVQGNPRFWASSVAMLVLLTVLATACSDGGGSQVTCNGGESEETTSTLDGQEAGPAMEPGTVPADGYESIGRPDADVVVLVAQGGPVLSLAVNRVEMAFAGIDLDEVQVVLVPQAQTVAPERFLDADISFGEAQDVDAQSVALLIDAIRHFEAQDRRVFVVGLSFGTFVVQDMLARHDPSADGYLLMAGRLDMPAEAWEIFANGDAPGFVDGTDVILRGTGLVPRERNMARLAAGLAHNRYSELLAGVDLCDVVYVSGEDDERVGRLADHEREVLESQGAPVIIGPGRHDETIETSLDRGLALLLGQQVVRP